MDYIDPIVDDTTRKLPVWKANLNIWGVARGSVAATVYLPNTRPQDRV